jgi:effector-binding domain-containing protein
MSDDIEIVQRQSQPSLAVKATVATFRMPMIMGKAYGSIMAHMQAKGIEMSGAPYTLYQDIDWQAAGQSKGLSAFFKMFTQKWKMEIGVPVAVDTAGEGEVIPATIPAGRYLKTLHRGPYAKVSEAYDRLMAYAHNNSLKLGPYSLELYLNDPESVPKEQLETEVMIALLD